MAFLRSTRSVYVSILFLMACFYKQGRADYDSDLCTQYAKGGTDTKETPYFYDDYYAATEITTYAKDGSIQGRVEQRDIRYAYQRKQLDVDEKRRDDRMYYYVDVQSQRCVFYNYETRACEMAADTCSTIQDLEKDYLKLTDDKISLSESARKLWWPIDDQQKKSIVKMNTKSSVRNVKTVKYVTCAHDSAEDITTVAEWQVLDLDSYQQMDETKNIVLMVKFHQSKNKALMESRRIDFFVYRELSTDELQYGLQIPESICHASRYNIPTTVPPFPLRFSYTREVDEFMYNDRDHVTRYAQDIEYNAMSQVIKAKNYHDRNDEMEKEVSFKYTDYSTKHSYFFSESTGNCSILAQDEDSENMPTPMGVWNIKHADPHFITMFRGIPCVELQSWDPEAPLEASYLMIATPEWLKNQGRDENEFYPVRTTYIFTGKDSKAGNIFEFNKNPGYHFPYLGRCFDQDTNVDASFVMRVNYENDVKAHLETFNYELRTLLKEITSVKASVRLSDFYFRAAKGFTRAHFRILGEARGMDRATNGAYYALDPVTSQEAVDKIKKAVDAGDVAFVFKEKNLDVKFEKGSFQQYFFKESQGQSPVSGYSSGAMAGVGIAMIVVGLALGVGAMFGYKKYSQGNLPALSFTFGKNGVNT